MAGDLHNRKESAVTKGTCGVSVCVTVPEERDKAEGTDKTSVTHTLPSLLAGGFLASGKTELHLTDYSILMTIAVLLGLLCSPGGGSRSKEQHEAAGGKPGTGTGWEGAEGVTGSPAPGESLYTSGNTHTPPSLSVTLLETSPFLPRLSLCLSLPLPCSEAS